MSIINWAPLKAKAMEAVQRAYAPYSQFYVGAAILTDRENIYSGCNVENAALGVTLCAESVAIGKSISEGEKRILALLVTTKDKNMAFPCGFCRQMLSEFVSSPSHCRVASLNSQGNLEETTLDFLLPKSFTLKT